VGNRFGITFRKRTRVGGWQIEKGGMTKCFLDDEIDQSLMMPPSLHDWLPEDH
jgi:hypothetical protein